MTSVKAGIPTTEFPTSTAQKANFLLRKDAFPYRKVTSHPPNPLQSSVPSFAFPTDTLCLCPSWTRRFLPSSYILPALPEPEKEVLLPAILLCQQTLKKQGFQTWRQRFIMQKTLFFTYSFVHKSTSAQSFFTLAFRCFLVSFFLVINNILVFTHGFTRNAIGIRPVTQKL